MGFDHRGPVDLGDLAHLEHDGIPCWVVQVEGEGEGQLIATRCASPNWSLPETTMRSPSSSPETIST